MLSENLQTKVDEYIDIYGQLRKKLRWKVADQRTLMLIASMYVVKNKPFNLKRYIELCDYIKNNVGAFSTLKSYQRFTTAAMLDIECDNPEKSFHSYLELYESFVDGGFSRGAFTYIAALTMLKDMEELVDPKSKVQRSLAVYKGMRNKHFFLTSHEDYPLAVLIANRDESIEKLMDHIEGFYDRLNENGFRKGNDLQFLSHILSLDTESDPDLLVDRCLKLWNTFKEIGIKPKATYYPEMGMLALLKDGAKEVSNVEKVANYLKDQKHFKWQKDMNFMMAVNLTVSCKMDNTLSMETGFHTIVEAIIQAQQAVNIATVAGVAAANNSAS
ncbi:DUF4003 domain-containing protein [Bacillus carboniphilus]|uniref:DUF4003 domain-containing protein n=1 Tax=Bacillus carboniphilus TaxID=86663 RepID=A0ABN0VRT3_9BACI